ncbi:MAG: hypothetical protein IPK64_05965 [bacterium]|nr:hypothetical protein [bacterium]
MAHIIIIGDTCPGSSIGDELVRCGHTVAVSAPGDARADAGVNACDVVVLAGDAVSLGDPVAVSDGARGAAPAAPRVFLSDAAAAAGLTPVLRARIESAWCEARALRLSASQPGTDPAADSDVQQVGHELRSPLTVIKTALEVMAGDLRTWHAEPADVEAQLRMLEIALRNVRRLHRAVEWSQMLLSGARGGVPPVSAAGSPDADAHPAPAPEIPLYADGGAA